VIVINQTFSKIVSALVFSVVLYYSRQLHISQRDYFFSKPSLKELIAIKN
jgi:hypothetical protein